MLEYSIMFMFISMLVICDSGVIVSIIFEVWMLLICIVMVVLYSVLWCVSMVFFG